MADMILPTTGYPRPTLAPTPFSRFNDAASPDYARDQAFSPEVINRQAIQKLTRRDAVNTSPKRKRGKGQDFLAGASG